MIAAGAHGVPGPRQPPPQQSASGFVTACRAFADVPPSPHPAFSVGEETEAGRPDETRVSFHATRQPTWNQTCFCLIP